MFYLFFHRFCNFDSIRCYPVGDPKYRRITFNEENVNIVEIQVDRVDHSRESDPLEIREGGLFKIVMVIIHQRD